MSFFIRMPSLAENVDTVTVTEWKKQGGASVSAGEEIADLTTEKATFPLTVEESGTLTHILAPVGSVLPPGFILAILDGTEEDASAAESENAKRIASMSAPSTTAVSSAGTSSSKTTVTDNSATSVRATPAARRLAKSLGISLEEIAIHYPAGTLLREEHIQQHSENKS